jgi:protein TonB
MFEFQVDHGARLLPNTALPEYPAALRGAKIEGKVLAQFVLDTSGRYVPGTFKVLMSSHEQFTRAVASALPALRFRPAEVRGRRVKQLLQVPFTFAPSAH